MAKKELSVDYSVTITTFGRFRKLDPSIQFDELKIIMNMLPSFVKKTLIAECHKDYTIHLHGIISFDMSAIPRKYYKCPRKFLFDYFRESKIIGFMKVDQITDFSNWIVYLNKNFKETYDAIHRLPLIVDEYNLFDNLTAIELST